jgi:hypothetical protein
LCSWKKRVIKYVFYKQEGISRLLVQQLGAENQKAVFEQIHAFPLELRAELAK